MGVYPQARRQERTGPEIFSEISKIQESGDRVKRPVYLANLK